MSLLKVTKEQKRSLAIATGLAVAVGVFFLQHYLILIAVAAIVAYLFMPVYDWLINKGQNQGKAGVITFFATLLAIIIPVSFVVFVTVIQINSLVKDISTASYSTNLTDLMNSIINSANNLLAQFGISTRLTMESVTSAMSNSLEQYGKAIASGLASSVAGVFSAITIGIIYIYVFMSLLINRKKLQKSIGKLNPLGPEISNLYFDRMGSMTKATVRGQFIIAICQGIESAVILSIAGLSDLFFFFALLLTTLSVVPLGAGIITIPIGIVMILTGNVWQGVLVIANHLLIVTNIDNVLRPKLVPKEARLDSALMMLSVFSGIAFFGFVGIVLGPVLMIVIVTTIQMFMEVFRDTASLSKGETLRNDNKGFFSSVKRLLQPR